MAGQDVGVAETMMTPGRFVFWLSSVCYVACYSLYDGAFIDFWEYGQCHTTFGYTMRSLEMRFYTSRPGRDEEDRSRDSHELLQSRSSHDDYLTNCLGPPALTTRRLAWMTSTFLGFPVCHKDVLQSFPLLISLDRPDNSHQLNLLISRKKNAKTVSIKPDIPVCPRNHVAYDLNLKVEYKVCISRTEP